VIRLGGVVALFVYIMNKLRMKTWFDEHTIVPICTAGLLMSVSSNILLIALPFVVKRLGGSDGTVGMTMSLNYTAYLIACIALFPILDKFNSKRLVQVGAIGIAMSTLGLFATVLWANRLLQPIWIVNLFVILIGVFTASYWPPMMGWISRVLRARN